MLDIQVSKREVNIKELYKRQAQEDDVDNCIDEPCNVYCNGEKILHYDNFDVSDIRKILPKIKFIRSTRVSGFQAHTKSFGYQAKSMLKNNPCAMSRFASEQPEYNHLILSKIPKIEQIYEREFPEKYTYHQEIVNKTLLSDWILPGSVFTSGIINRNNPILYHHDSNNFKGVCSAMLNFRDNIAGGNLVLPEYNVKFSLKNNTIIYFEGKSILHGVTPIQCFDKTSERFSIVYYSVEALKECLSCKEEIEYIKKRKTELLMQARK